MSAWTASLREPSAPRSRGQPRSRPRARRPPSCRARASIVARSAVDSPEPEFVFDERGNITQILAREQTESHRLIEHLMIAANEAVAGLLARQKVPCLYRVHERPEPERIERLIAQLASLQVPTPPLPERLSAAQAAELLGVISQRLEEHVRRTSHGRRALGSLLLRSLKQAYYSPKNLGHAGLRSSGYCHFTSPIRRYPDLVCHRALLAAVGGGERAPRAGELGELGVWTSEREREAMTIERDADDVAACFDLERRLYEGGWEQTFGGEVVGLISAGAFVAFAPAAADTAGGEEEPTGSGAAGVYEGMLPVRRMHVPGGERDWWEINEQGTILRGERTGTTLRLGDRIEVRCRARGDASAGASICCRWWSPRRTARLVRRWQRAKESARSVRAMSRPTATPRTATSCSSGSSAGSCSRAPRSRRCASRARS